MFMKIGQKAFLTIVWVVILMISVFTVIPAQAAGQLSSTVYTIDRNAGILEGVLPGTTASELTANMEEDASSLSVCKSDGGTCGGRVATGMTLRLTEGGAVSDSLAVSVLGDVSGDGEITVADYTLARLYLMGLKTLSGAKLGAADADLNGAVSISDYTRIRLHILGLCRLGDKNNLPLAGFIIGLDPGHQTHANSNLEPLAPGSSDMKKKVSSGTQGRYTRVPEYVVNLQVGLKLKEKLEELGATVVMTRTKNDVNISNAERAVMMNKAAVNCWLRIHVNGNSNGSVHGISILAPVKGTMNTKDASVQEKSVELAKTLLAPVISCTGAKNNGVPLRSDQTGFCWSSVPVCNIEMGYMTNETEDKLIVTDDYQNKVVDGLAQGFLNYFK